MARAHALIVVGEDRHDLAGAFAATLPVLRARLQPVDPAALAGRRVLAFAGIGRPEKFRDTLEAAGAMVAGFTPFPDHHRFTDVELRDLSTCADRANAELVTTEKDWVRLDASLRDSVTPVPVVVAWQDESQIVQLLARLGFHG
jgi:tetraacyldisaccharide 4'-kinase